jgi:PAS domain S-box-containing protein
MKLNPDLDGLATYRPLPDGTWQQILHIHRDGTAHALASDCAKDSQLLQRAWTGESVFDSGSLLAKGCRRVRSLQPVRDAAGRVEAVLEVEFSTARWTAAILRGRTFTFVRLYILAAMVGAALVIARQRRRFQEHLREEERLRESENRFRQLCETIPNIAVQGYDRQRRVTFWNHASEKLYGYTKEEALGRALEDLIIPEEMRAGVIEGIKNWHETGTAIPAGELILRHKNGGPVSVFSSHAMQRDSRGEPEMYCVDVSLAERDAPSPP